MLLVGVVDDLAINRDEQAVFLFLEKPETLLKVRRVVCDRKFIYNKFYIELHDYFSITISISDT